MKRQSCTFFVLIMIVGCHSDDIVVHHKYEYGIELNLTDEQGAEISREHIEILEIMGSFDFNSDEYKPKLVTIDDISSKLIVLFPNNNVGRKDIASFVIHQVQYQTDDAVIEREAVVNFGEIEKESFTLPSHESEGSCILYSPIQAAINKNFIRNIFGIIFPTAYAMGNHRRYKCVKEFGEWDRINLTLEATPQ